MKTIRIQDLYNDSKVWVIKKTKCRHYYWTQEICGSQYYPFSRTTKKNINDVLDTMVTIL